MRVLGIDYGERNIGVAISDPGLRFAFGLTVIRRANSSEFKPCIAALKGIIEEYDVETVVLGYPVNLDGCVSSQCLKTQEFKERLGRNFKQIEIVLWDERYSTRAVARVLNEAKVGRAAKDEVIDKMAAVYILQGYLDSLNVKPADGRGVGFIKESELAAGIGDD